MTIDSGPPRKRSKFINEESLPEPQMIKQIWVGKFFYACGLVAKYNYFKRLTKRTSPLLEARLQESVEELFIMLSMKHQVLELKQFKEIKERILTSGGLSHRDICDILFVIGNVLQELGPLKIEYVRGVSPEVAFLEGEILGDM